MDENVESNDVTQENSEQPTQTPPPEDNLKSSAGKDDKLWAIACHLSAFSSFVIPFGNIIGPLIVWMIKKDEIPAVDINGKRALNFQISMSIYMLASSVLICGGPLVLLAWIPLAIIGFVFTIIATIKTSNGEDYSYPMSLNLVK
jgi:uncharacterized Tic20 family protein